MPIVIRNNFKLVLLLSFVLLIGLSFTGCNGGRQIDTTYNLTIEVEGEGTTEPEPGNYEFSDGEMVNVEAIYDDYEFVRWEGNVRDPKESETSILMESNETITAVFEEDETASVDPGEMVLVEAGEKGGVEVEEDFYIGKYHVTQAEFEEVMGFNPSEINDDAHPNLTGDTASRPVERVTWYDAVKYANKLSESEGLNKYYNVSDIEYDGDNIDDATVTENEDANGYRLPTEDEHEYAARGGKDGDATTYAGSDDLDEVGWYMDNSDEANSSRSDNRGTMPVGEKEANELGLYDMSGNVSDWTNTPSGSDRVGRGGRWYFISNICVVSYYNIFTPSGSSNVLGFRLARRP